MMNRTIVSVALFLSFMMTSVRSQEVGDDTRVSAQRQSQIDQELNTNINFCRELMRDRNFEGASAMLELLYDKHPKNSVIVGLLVQCYDKLQYYEKSQAIIERHLEVYPGNFNFQLFHAEVLTKQGKLDEAAGVYLKAAKAIPLENRVRYRLVVQSMVTNRLDDAAVRLIDSLRLISADSNLFAIQRGTVLERQKNYEAAAMEFYSLLDDTTRDGNAAEKKLIALLNFVESEPATEKTLLEQNSLAANPRTMKVLSSHYLKSGQYEKAFEFTIGQDSLEGLSGASLLTYMRNCFERKLYDQTVRMGHYLLRRADTLDLTADGYLVYGDALRWMGKYEEAIAVYDTVFATYDRYRYRAEALYRIGKICLEDIADYDRALVYFDSVHTYYSKNRLHLSAMVARPHCYLRMGQLDRAKEEFEKVLQHPLESDLLENAQYHLALINFFGKQVDSSLAALSKVLVEFPRGMYVNDAVRLMYTIEQARTYPQLLYDYSNALLFRQRDMADSAVVKLCLIAGASDSVLGDVAFYELAQISLNRFDTLAAIEHIDSLEARFPQSYYIPYGLQLKADLLSMHNDGLSEATDLYRRLLKDYPNFPFISTVRQKVRQIEGLIGAS